MPRRPCAALLASATRAQFSARSDGTAWTNEQLLFHMVFGFLIVARLLPLVRLMPRLPAPFGRGSAITLDAGHRPFHVVNYLGSCTGASTFNRHRMGWLCDRTIRGLTCQLASEPELNLHRPMPLPARDAYSNRRGHSRRCTPARSCTTSTTAPSYPCPRPKTPGLPVGAMMNR